MTHRGGRGEEVGVVMGALGDFGRLIAAAVGKR